MLGRNPDRMYPIPRIGDAPTSRGFLALYTRVPERYLVETMRSPHEDLGQGKLLSPAARWSSLEG